MTQRLPQISQQRWVWPCMLMMRSVAISCMALVCVLLMRWDLAN
jgi:hypothetical protein